MFRLFKRFKLQLGAKEFALEILAIFIGITLSFLFEEWRKSREEKVLEKQILSGILVDLNENEKLILNDSAECAQALHAGVRLLSEFDSLTLSPDSIMNCIYHTQIVRSAIVKKSAYTSSVNSGNMLVVNDEELSRQLSVVFDESLPYYVERNILLMKDWFFERNLTADGRYPEMLGYASEPYVFGVSYNNRTPTKKLLRELNAYLKDPLEYEKLIISIIKVRAAFEMDIPQVLSEIRKTRSLVQKRLQQL